MFCTPRSRRIAATLLCVSILAGPAGCGNHDEGEKTGRLDATLEGSESEAAVPDSPPTSSFDTLELTARWAPALVDGRTDEVRALCSAWIEDNAAILRLEGYKCLANVEIALARLPSALPTDPSKSALRPRFTPQGIDASLDRYAMALAIAPRDRDAHLGRMDIMILAGRYRDANLALEETLQTFSSREYLGDWFKLLGRFRILEAFEEGLEFLKIIEAHHPLDHRVVANIGAYYAVLHRYDEALEYSKRAVALNPDSGINQWNLARLYGQRSDLEKADATYQIALGLFRDEDPLARCDYARFLMEQIQDRKRACEYAEASCAEYYDEACLESAG